MADDTARRALDSKRKIDQALRALPATAPRRPPAPTPKDLAMAMLNGHQDAYTTLAALRAHPACKKSDARAFEVILAELVRRRKITWNTQGRLDPFSLIRAFKDLFCHQLPATVAQDLPLVVARELANACNQRCGRTSHDMWTEFSMTDTAGLAVARELFSAVTTLFSASQTDLAQHVDHYCFLMHFAAWMSGFGPASVREVPNLDLAAPMLRLAPGMDRLGLWKMSYIAFTHMRFEVLKRLGDQPFEEADDHALNLCANIFGHDLARHLSPAEHGVMVAALIRNLTPEQGSRYVTMILQRVDETRQHEIRCSIAAEMCLFNQASIDFGMVPSLGPDDLGDVLVYARQIEQVDRLLASLCFYPREASAAGYGPTPDCISAIMHDRYERGQTPLTRERYFREVEALCNFNVQQLPLDCHKLANRLRLNALCDLLHANRDLLGLTDYMLALKHWQVQLADTGAPNAPRSEAESDHRAMVVARLYDLLGVLAKLELREARGDWAPQFATAEYLLKLPAVLDLERWLTKEEFNNIKQALQMLAAGHGATPLAMASTPTPALTTTSAAAVAGASAAAIAGASAPAATATTAATTTTTARLPQTADHLISLSMTPEEQEAVRARHAATLGAGEGAGPPH